MGAAGGRGGGVSGVGGGGGNKPKDGKVRDDNTKDHSMTAHDIPEYLYVPIFKNINIHFWS